MKIILKCDRETPRIWMLNQLNWMSIAQKIKFNTLIMIFKIKNGLTTKYLNDFMIETIEIHIKQTRNK